jgi:hypothetical protein
MKIKSKDYACTTCGQTFTRRDSGKRNNIHINNEKSEIIFFTDILLED